VIDIIDLTAKCKNWSSRKGHNILAIVNHITAGSRDSAIAWFANTLSQASSHYIVDTDGKIYQMVNEENKAWHAGIVDHPSNKFVIANMPLNPNLYTIGIEHVNFGGGALTEPQYQATLELQKSLISKYNIPIDRDHILGHYEIDSINRPYCPGKFFPWNRLMNDLEPKYQSFLKIGSQGNDVYELQLKLKTLGYSITPDSKFGNETGGVIKLFQHQMHLTEDGVVGDITLNKINDMFYQNCNGFFGYKKIRNYGSDIHVYATNKAEDVDIFLDTTKTPLSKISIPNKNVVCKINGSFFNMLPNNQDSLGIFVDNGKIYSPEGIPFLDLIYYKNGNVVTGRISDDNTLLSVENTANWALGTSWSLVVNSHINIQNTQYFDMWNTPNPRTILGKRKDGSWVLAVAQGRKLFQRGLTANEEAEIMFSLGCEVAINLDGGGSTEMILNGKVMNSPTDGQERPIRCCVYVYKK
jgi:N-acetyl-anhydromuramyl-L-alanine amidase AmpD/exopolysaccharide biosynthesis protein